jgi:hypothetical protein
MGLWLILGPLGLLALGPRPASSRKRGTYAQAIVLCESKDVEAARAAVSSLPKDLYFESSQPQHFDDYAGFEAECRQYLTRLIQTPYRRELKGAIPVPAGFGIYRVIPPL